MWLLIGGIAWYFAAYTGIQHPVMRYPALAYTLLLSTTAGATTGLSLSNPRVVPVALGAILFLVSDLLLANWIFHGIVYRPFDLVWLSYGLGQMLIVYGFTGFIHRTEPRVTS